MPLVLQDKAFKLVNANLDLNTPNSNVMKTMNIEMTSPIQRFKIKKNENQVRNCRLVIKEKIL